MSSKISRYIQCTGRNHRLLGEALAAFWKTRRMEKCGEKGHATPHATASSGHPWGGGRREEHADGGAERVRGGGKKAEPRPHRPPLGSTALAAKAALVRQGASPRGRADVAPAAVRWPPTIRASRPRCCVPPPVERLCSAAVR
ncbi:unnamed protein product [Prorocentrum cordatum]|uniref:Uncharacterized protein n=1 Tax=Prorocentrum cordatum TaxID=2364126 RepID=A0ABN9VG20_9DINO|nr:unnamed protein product [Polarella glacialis]